ncbi:hypothetical protein [Legionella maioricensis]|uniref:Uncharacterized protein n=1 Tax=Legionella maioricensis TaxID=2896528 RepID=A0A9X2IBU2_9GAMM|nr:hypothetical protein [Legionella maioricensis]MCL9683737.1 hypothetical protein [Legionella maioricensis]MCL9687511.1 hypothetical protein [Legionella maioricensis]
MEKARVKNYGLLPILLASFILLIGTFYSVYSNASNNASQPPGTQLAYFIGYHSYGGYYLPGYIYYGPRHYPRRAYWTGWRSIGYGCRQTCLIDRWSGRAIRCSRRCI